MQRKFTLQEAELILESKLILLNGKLLKNQSEKREVEDILSVEEWIAVFIEFQNTSISQSELCKKFGITNELFKIRKSEIEKLLSVVNVDKKIL